MDKFGTYDDVITFFCNVIVKEIEYFKMFSLYIITHKH